ncbi:MAG: tRNA pseudouridine(38-40) synthase TruA [Pseudomonadota bacterium]|nr:tRNA pseudouridine(38-40) synthase TruA [Pseudomonadota bacterium]
MTRWALGLEYDGAAFHGFQRQPHHDHATVQGSLEAALSKIADESVRLVCAGRTDAGVHAVAQVVHFDCSAERDPRAWLRGANSLTPSSLSVRWAQVVDGGFHARFSASARSYLYVLSDGEPVHALLRDRVAAFPDRLDAHAMEEAARILIGEHDFSSFRAAGCQARHAVREVLHCAVHRNGALLGFEIRANAFLQHMVRNLVGSLALVGSGRRSVGWFGDVLAARDRTQAGPAAPPEGLYFVEVSYPDHPDLPSVQRPPLPWGLVMPPS